MTILLTVDNLDAVNDVTSRITALLRRAHKIGPKDPDDFKVQSSQSLTKTIRARVEHHHRWSSPRWSASRCWWAASAS